MTALVVMATYNGEHWLDAQLDSLRAQSDGHWRLLVSDDGSQDGTVPIVRRRALTDARIRLLPRRAGVPNHVANFEYLLQQAAQEDCTSIFLADQDDLWHTEKLAIQQQDLTGGSLAACSDLAIIDADGRVQGYFWKKMGLDPNFRLRSHLAQNAVVGCSLAFRPDLLRLALPFPKDLQNHDWWLALCALALGGLHVNRQALLQYRQHDNNMIGLGNRISQWRRRKEVIQRHRRILDSKIVAVAELISRLRQMGHPVPDELHEYYLAFHNRGLLPRIHALLGPFRPKRFLFLGIQLLAVAGRR